MPMLKAPRTVSRRQELRQDVVVTGYARLVQLYEENRTYVIGAAIALVAVILMGIAWSFYTQNQEQRAAEQLGGIVRIYEQENYRQALDGTADKPGLIEIVDSFGGTESGNLARFYAGDALFRLGEKEEALRYFEAFDKGDDFLGASAYAGEAAVHEDLGQYEEAAGLYEDAAAAFESSLLTPDYLLRAARNYEAAGESDRARALYERIQELYPDTQPARDAEFLLAQLGA